MRDDDPDFFLKNEILKWEKNINNEYIVKWTDVFSENELANDKSMKWSLNKEKYSS